MNHGSLFSGIGGFELAARWMRWRNIFSCEIDPLCRKVLAYHFPETDILEDIKNADFTKYRGRVDVISGGFPCQPFSAAGKRGGTDDDRYLWPEMYRVIQEVSPRWVVAENVRGIVNWSEGLVFEQVCSDLENIGYEVQPFILPAVSVNAPHRRDRVWFIAYSDNAGAGKQLRINGDGEKENEGRQRQPLAEPGENCRDVTHANGLRYRGRGIRPLTDKQEEQPVDSDKKGDGNGVRSEIEGCGGLTPDSKGGRCGLWPADNPGAPPGKINAFSNEAEICAQQSRHAIIPDWENFPTQSPVCQRDDGIPGGVAELSKGLKGGYRVIPGGKLGDELITESKWRRESIKAYGNAVVPVLVYEIFKAIGEMR